MLQNTTILTLNQETRINKTELTTEYDLEWTGDASVINTPVIDLYPYLPEDINITGITVTLSNILSGYSPTYSVGIANVKLTTKTFEEPYAETITSIVQSSNYQDITFNIKIILTGKYIVTISAQAKDAIYDGTAKVGYANLHGTLTNGDNYTGSYTYSYKDADGTILETVPVEVGDYTVTIAVPEDNADYKGSLTLNFSIKPADEIEVSYQTEENGEWRNSTFTEAIAEVYEGGIIKLLKSINLDETVTIAKKLTITSDNVNSPVTITSIVDGHGYLFRVIDDVTFEKITIDGGSENDITASRALIAVGDGTNYGTLTLGEGAVLRNNNNTTVNGAGGAVCAISGDLNVSGGHIIGNTAFSGSAIAVMANSCDVNISNGSLISDNDATNTAYNGGGAIYISAGIVTMSEGEIKNNTAINCGGAVFLGKGNNSSNASFKIQGGTITANTAKYGAGIYASYAQLIELSGGNISGNNATSDGGGVYVAPDNTIAISGSVVVNNNTASNNADNVYLLYGPNVTIGKLDDNAKVDFFTIEKPEDNAELLIASPATGYNITTDDIDRLSYEDSEYGFQLNESGNIVLVKTLAENIEYVTLNLESPRGLKDIIKINIDATVADLKATVAEKCNVTFDENSEYRLFGEDLQYPNSSLSDDTKVLREIGFTDNQTIHLEKSTNWDASGDEPIKIFGLTITSGKGSQEPYGDYNNVDYYWNYYHKTITMKSTKAITISGTGEHNTNIIIKKAGDSSYTNLTISDLVLTNDDGACINVQGNSWVKLTVKGNNILTSTGENAPYTSNQYPALTLTNSGAYLKIMKASDGTLTATTNIAGQPGIGTYDNTSSVWGVEINGGTIIANGGEGAAGIRAQAVCIYGGNVTANGGIDGYGNNTLYENSIEILGGTVIANSDNGKALSSAPNLDSYDDYEAIASVNTDGSNAVKYDSSSNDTYKYFKIAPAGTYNENLTWSFDNSTLIIYGIGTMDEYEEGETPWNGYNNQIDVIVVEGGVTHIGNNAFNTTSATEIFFYGVDNPTLGTNSIPETANVYVPTLDTWNDISWNNVNYMPTLISQQGWVGLKDGQTEPSAEDHVAINTPLVLLGQQSSSTLSVKSFGYCGDGTTVNGSITIEDGGQLYCEAARGEVTVKKEIIGYAGQQSTVNSQQTSWYTISSPLKDTIPNSSFLTPNSDLYRYDEPSYTWQNSKPGEGSTNFQTIDPGRGYLYANAENTTLEFKGEINTETVTYNLTAQGEKLKGFHLIGNPFTHNIMFSHLTTSGNATLANGYYILNGDGTWGTTLGNNAEDVIKPGQGALIKTTADGKLAISSQQSANRSQHTTDNGQQSLFKLSVTNGKHSDRAFVVFDKGVGLDKINHENENIPLLYIPMEDADYAIAMMDENVNEIPVNFETKVMGQYTISLRQENCNLEGMYLLDKETGEKVNILEEDYTFIATSQDNAERFVLTMNSDTDSDSDNSHFAYINNGGIVIFDIEGDANIRIVDALGRCVYNGECSDEIHRVDAASHFPTCGVYIIEKIDDKGINVQKIIL